MSNYAAPPQLVADVPYRDMAGMEEFARRRRGDHLGEWFTTGKLSGFCLLMTRAVYEKIGGLDERFGLGFFDDDDLAERARRAGFALAVAHDVFVHHFGSRTFVGNGIDAGKLLDENAGRFAAKWGVTETTGRRVALRPFGDGRLKIADGRDHAATGSEASSRGAAKSAKNTQTIIVPDRGDSDDAETAADTRSAVPFAAWRLGVTSSSDSAARPGKRARVSLTVIARNEENNLPHCLASVAGVFDEVVVVDTGSTDRTVEIAREFGARVFDFGWIDDFSAARNEALAHATGDYAFWLDADDVIEPDELEKLKVILAALRVGEDAGYVVRCKCDPSPDGTGGDTVVDHVRLFPLRPGVRWSYRVHEQILPSLREAKIPVRWTDVTVRHTGYVDKALRERKLERDTRLLLLELDEKPGHPFVCFNLGCIAIERRRWDEALEFFYKSLASSVPTDSIVRKIFAQIARAHQMKGNSQAALGACERGLAVYPEDAELWFRKGIVHRHRGESALAESCWRRILTLTRPDEFCSVDQGIYGHLTRRNLAVLAMERGDFGEAETLWREVLVECPGDREALVHLGGRSLGSGIVEG
jgi:GT2 family glycosyltransferase